MMKQRSIVTSILFILFALGGIWFAGVSTYDFIMHLDGQVHSITCSYIPGTAERDILGTSDCYTVMMSPYSSVMRDYTWGGIPIALPGLAVFLYMLFIGIEFLLNGRHSKRSESAYLLLASLLPLVTSIAYYVISVIKVGEVCKMCVGIYVMSMGLFVSSLVQFLIARPDTAPGPKQVRNQVLRYALYFLEGVLFVAVSVIIYLNAKPDYQIQNCGELVKPEDRSAIMLGHNPDAHGTTAIEVLDPLCPPCLGFRERLFNSDISRNLNLKIVLFPLDSECNWMLKQPVHHGACEVSRAVLCANDKEAAIMWALKNNLELRKLAQKEGTKALRAKITQRFGDMSKCMDSSETKTRLNLSMRWIMANSLPLLTPQLYVNNRRLCDSDMDLGLEYGLGKLLKISDEGGI